MDTEEKIQAHVLSVWRERREFFGGRGREGMLILTNKRLMFVKKTEAGMKWWGAVRTRQIVRLLRSKDVMFTEDGYDEESLRTDAENKANQEITFNNILDIRFEEKVWGSVLFLEILENTKKRKYQFSIVQDWVKYPLSAPTKYMNMGTVYAVGVGPGSPNYITETVKKIIIDSDIVVGYKYTLSTISTLTQNKEVYEITMENQEKTYQKIHQELGDKILVIPFTGDVNFSESEVVDRLIEIFGDVKIISGISSIQVAASKAKIPLDKSKIITMHVSTSIEEKKIELQKALIDGYNVILIPRPWPNEPQKHFMPSEVAFYLKKNGFDTPKIPVHVFESLTNGKEFSDLCVMVFGQATLESYINFE